MSHRKSIPRSRIGISWKKNSDVVPGLPSTRRITHRIALHRVASPKRLIRRSLVTERGAKGIGTREERDRKRRGSRKHIDQETVVGRMPRGDATRGAGLSTYYEPRLLSSRFFFSPRVSPPTTPSAVVFLPSVPFCVFYHPLAPPPPPPPPHHDPTESPFSPRYFTAPRSPLRILYLLVFSGLVFIPNTASRMRNVRPCTCTYIHV